jgi:ABC-type branched-subunit amino acid transport system substrate-binding protein
VDGILALLLDGDVARMITPMDAAVTLSLSGPFARQGREAARGLALWADEAGVALTVVDDGGSRQAATRAYGGWLDAGVDLLLGPYGSGLVRAVAPPVCGAGRLLWNHGGSADDLARPGLVSLPAPASTYFHGAVDEAAAGGVGRLLAARGAGPFARAVAEGAVARAAARGLDARMVEAASLAATDAAGAAVLVVGRFEEDVALVRSLRGREAGPALLGAVAAGLPAFGELGEAAEGVLGPVQWWPTSRTPRVGPSGAGFAAGYRRRFGPEPSYVAAQAAAAGHLALAAHRLGLAPGDLPGWRTSTLLGDFALDGAWRQVGHRVTTIRWRDGRMVPAARIAVQFPRGRDS